MSVFSQRTGRIGMAFSCRRAGPGNLTDCDLPRRFQRDNDQIAVLNCIAELIELRGEVQLLSRLRVRPGLLNKLEHSGTVLGGPEVANAKAENEFAALKRVSLLLPMLAEPDQPETLHAVPPTA